MRLARAERRAREVKDEQRENETRKGAAREGAAGTQGCDTEQVQIRTDRAAKHQHSNATGSGPTTTFPRTEHYSGKRNVRYLHADSAATIEGMKSKTFPVCLDNYNK